MEEKKVKNTLGLTVIIKDDSELGQLKKLIESCKKYVDRIYITANNEPSKKIKRFCVDSRAIFSFEKWTNNFAKQRNFNFSQNKCDYGIWADTDDVIIGADKLPALVEKMNKENINLVYMNYNYAQAEDDITGLVDHDRPRVYKNDGKCYWEKSVHETLNRPDERSIKVDDIFVLQNYDGDKKYDKELRNFKILTAEYNKDGDKTDPRTLHYLGSSSYGLAMEVKERDELLEQAIFFYREHIKKSGWDDESYKSYCGIAYCLTILKRNDQAINALLKAAELRPDWDEAYWLLAKAYTDQEQYGKAIEFGEIALIKKEPDTPLGVNKMLRKWAGPANLVTSYIMVNRYQEASKLFNSINNGSDNAKKLGEIVQDTWEMNDFINKTFDVVQYTKKLDNKSTAKLVENLPDHLMQHPMMQELRIENSNPKIWDKKSVVIMCGNSLEDWADPSLIKGIGGSETAVIYLSRELAKKGYEVTVFNRCGQLKGDYFGVHYRPYWEFNPKDSFNWLIAWRNPEMCEFVSAKQLWLWNHDKMDNFSEETIEKVDKFVFLSKWQAEQTNAPKDKWFLTSNGIKMYDLQEKNPYMLISTSSYDRGLEHLLTNWPKLKNTFPKLELHICYGWENYDKMGGSQEWKAKMVALMKQKGIVDHGRVGEKELAKLIGQANLWTYYSHFWEINCIGAIMAQSLGAIPVTTSYAALDETVQYGVKVDGISEMGSMPEVVEQELVKETINLLKDKKKQEKLRSPMINWARKTYSWEKIADNWIKEYGL